MSGGLLCGLISVFRRLGRGRVGGGVRRGCGGGECDVVAFVALVWAVVKAELTLLSAF
jgi:hypothetical protein